jgi:putative chitobiose transport system permease protein
MNQLGKRELGKRELGKRGRSAAMYLLLTIIAVLMLAPLVWLLSTALKSPGENLFQLPPELIPRQPTLDNFVKVWQLDPDHPFWRYVLNSVWVSALTVALNLLFCALGAYPLARLTFKGRELIFTSIVATILIPFQIVMIPLFILMRDLGLRNTYLGIIFPAMASAFGIFLLRQAFQGVPKEMEEAARLDGCSELGIWWHVMLPSIRPALITLAIFVFIGSWSDFLWPLIVTDKPDMYTLPLGVAKLSGTSDTDWRLVAAGSVLSILPIIGFFVAMQRYIVPTEASSGVKG